MILYLIRVVLHNDLCIVHSLIQFKSNKLTLNTGADIIFEEHSSGKYDNFITRKSV